MLLLAGCAGSLSPLYEDYRISESAKGSNLHDLVEQAVLDAGWILDEPDAPNVVSTEEVTVTNWGLYRVVVSLDVVPINKVHVRVYVHPYRVYAWGSRSKMPYMSRRVRNFVLPHLSDTLAAHGIVDVEVNLADDTST